MHSAGTLSSRLLPSMAEHHTRMVEARSTFDECIVGKTCLDHPMGGHNADVQSPVFGRHADGCYLIFVVDYQSTNHDPRSPLVERAPRGFVREIQNSIVREPLGLPVASLVSCLSAS